MDDRRPLIVHVIHHLVIGGMENGLVNLINRVPEHQYRHAIICAEDYSDFRKRIRNQDVPVYQMHRHRGGQLRLYWRLFRLLRTLRPAIVHTRNRSGLDGLLPALMAGVSIRLHGEHGWDVDDIDGRNRKLRNLRRIHRPLISRYICVSRHLCQYLVERVGVAPNRVTQIYNGVDTSKFRPRAANGERPVASAWKPIPRLTVGTLGRLQPIKNQLTLLRAVSLIVDRQPELRSLIGVAIIGDGPERQKLDAYVEQSGLRDVIRFFGARDDVADLLPDFDVFVLPSLAEGISNTILEAMACGLPVIATRVGGNPELVEHGRTGMLVDTDDPEALAGAILHYFNNSDDMQRHAGAARKAAVDRFSIDRMVREYTSLYDELLSPRGASPARARERAG